MSKKVSLPITVTAVLLAAAIAFSAAYMISYFTLNRDLEQLSEKKAMFGNLAEVDSVVREKYQGEINEEELNDALCKAYAETVGDGVLYFTKEEFQEERYTKEQGYIVSKLSNGDAIVIALSENTTETPVTPDEKN